MLIAVIFLLAIPGGVTSAGSDRGRSVSSTCHVLEAVYTSALEITESSIKAPVVHPSTVIAQEHVSPPLAQWSPDYVAELPLRAAEFAELARRDGAPGPARFLPDCVWNGAEQDVIDHGRHFATSFSRPVLAASGELALVKVSFRDGGFGYGEVCIARRTRRTWRATCRADWIT